MDGGGMYEFYNVQSIDEKLRHGLMRIIILNDLKGSKKLCSFPSLLSVKIAPGYINNDENMLMSFFYKICR